MKNWYENIKVFKRPWLYSRWDFRDTFHKLVFHVIWCGNILKLPMVHISEVPEPFFLKTSQMWWNLDFLAILAEYVAGVAKKLQQMIWGSSKKVSEGEQVENFTFFEFLTCFLTCFDGFFAISKKSGTDCPKKKFKVKI